MNLTEFPKGAVIYRTKPVKCPVRGGYFGIFGSDIGSGEDRSYMSDPYILSSVKGNLAVILNAKDLSPTKLELDRWDDENWDYYPVFEEEQGNFVNLSTNDSDAHYFFTSTSNL